MIRPGLRAERRGVRIYAIAAVIIVLMLAGLNQFKIVSKPAVNVVGIVLLVPLLLLIAWERFKD
jgi:hypothetical protein